MRRELKINLNLQVNKNAIAIKIKQNLLLIKNATAVKNAYNSTTKQKCNGS